MRRGERGGGGEAGPGTARPSSTTAATTLSEPLADPPLLLHQTAMLPPHFCNSASPLLSFRHHISSAFTPAFTPGVGRLLPHILPSPHLASSHPNLITRLRRSNTTFSSHYGVDNNNPSTMSTRYFIATPASTSRLKYGRNGSAFNLKSMMSVGSRHKRNHSRYNSEWSNRKGKSQAAIAVIIHSEG